MTFKDHMQGFFWYKKNMYFQGMGSPITHSGRQLLTGIALLFLDTTKYLHGSAPSWGASHNVDGICLDVGAAGR